MNIFFRTKFIKKNYPGPIDESDDDDWPEPSLDEVPLDIQREFLEEERSQEMIFEHNQNCIEKIPGTHVLIINKSGKIQKETLEFRKYRELQESRAKDHHWLAFNTQEIDNIVMQGNKIKSARLKLYKKKSHHSNSFPVSIFQVKIFL